MGFTQTDAIEVKQTKGKGRGVVSRRLILVTWLVRNMVR
jgi:hypothetical protein